MAKKAKKVTQAAPAKPASQILFPTSTLKFDLTCHVLLEDQILLIHVRAGN